MTAPTFVFAPATKKEAWARIALEGISGGGKTWTALTIAAALGKRIGVIDTEHRSAAKYANIFNFHHLPLDSYDPRVLIAALAAAGDQGMDVAIVDSLSHFWMGTDGMLEQVDRATKRASGHGMAGWKEMRPIERQMIEAMLAYPGHVIVTMRVKNDWVEGEVRGKRAMVKVGTKAEQREGLEYEFDIVGSLSADNELIIGKSRCPQLSGAVIAKPGLELGHTIREWLEDGETGGPTAAEFRARALAAAGDVAVLRPLHAEVRQAGLLAAPVLDAAGLAVSLGELIVRLGQQPAAAAPAQPAEPEPVEDRIENNGAWGGIAEAAQRRASRPVSGPPAQARPVSGPPAALSAAATGLLADLGQAPDRDALRTVWTAAGAAAREGRITDAEHTWFRSRWEIRKEHLFPARPATEEQHKKIFALCGEAGLDDRDTRLLFLGETVGRDIDTQKRLSVDDARRVIDRLEQAAAQAQPPAELAGATA